MSTLPTGDPLDGPVATHWVFGFDMPVELGGGFVSEQLLLGGEGMLLRRYSRSTGYGPWEEVSWWTPERDAQRAARILHDRGYDQPKPAQGRGKPEPPKDSHD